MDLRVAKAINYERWDDEENNYPKALIEHIRLHNLRIAMDYMAFKVVKQPAGHYYVKLFLL